MCEVTCPSVAGRCERLDIEKIIFFIFIVITIINIIIVGICICMCVSVNMCVFICLQVCVSLYMCVRERERRDGGGAREGWREGERACTGGGGINASQCANRGQRTTL